jgi:hypothetical protein
MIGATEVATNLKRWTKESIAKVSEVMSARAHIIRYAIAYQKETKTKETKTTSEQRAGTSHRFYRLVFVAGTLW